MAERGAEMPEGMILTVGRDAGVPHNAGQDGDPILIGAPVLLDLYPCQAGGGYFYDFTRTWCLGHVPEPVAQIYALVLNAHLQALASIRPGVTARSLQEQTCDLFESHGHPTLRSDPTTMTGYVHSLGHGVGLAIHEPPSFRSAAEGEEALRPGMVFAIEPGLYYPERGLGMRIEDTVWLRPDGQPEVLADYSRELLLPVRSRRAPARKPAGRVSRRS
jgi:Xaa-Pro aminopeptidase